MNKVDSIQRKENIMTKSDSGGGVGLFGLLTIVFITLKLTHFIDWSWWWVLSPILIPLTILGILGIVAIVIKILLDD
jgi:hypothetical protein